MRLILFALLFLFASVTPIQAQTTLLAPELSTSSVVATASPTASVSATVSPSATPVKEDLTQPSSETKSALATLIETHPAGPLSWDNFLRFFIERSVERGVPVNTLVLVILFPLAVTLVAASRHLIGIRGTGILTPALLAVAFLATGLWAGVVL
jgi:hypothetical protein